MKSILVLAAVAEAATGAALVCVPSLVGHLLLGAELTSIATVVARVTGVALIGLGLSCWPGPPLIGMLTYSALIALYLLYLGIRGEWVGPALWPAVALHVVLSFLLARACLGMRQAVIPDTLDTKAP